MASNKEVCEKSLRKTYNNIDCKDQLIYVEVVKNKFAGYRRELLVNPLSDVEIDFYVCTKCKGVMRNACQIGEEQNLVCEGCVKKGVPSQPLMKSRKKILELQAKCPLATRDCNWKGTLTVEEEHIDVCEKVVVKCKNSCDVILPRNELDHHLKQSCVKRRVKCEHCNKTFVYKKLTNHYQKCLEYQVPCPKNCGANMKRKLIDSHLKTKCPNMEVECPYKKFGCEQELLRCELEEHKKTNQIQHFESTSIFAVREMEQLKQTNIQLTERLNTLENQIEKLSYPIILRGELALLIASRKYMSLKSSEVVWKFLKIGVLFRHTGSKETISVSVSMENDNVRTPLAKWPFEGRFKLTIIDNINVQTSLIYESKIVELQPQNVPKGKVQYPSEFILAEMPMRTLLENRFTTKKKINFTFQIQESENQ